MAVMTAIAIAGLAMSAYGAVKQSQAQKKQAKVAEDAGEASAEQQEFNARIAETQAEDAILRGKELESQVRLGTKGLIGAQRAGFAGQGVDIGVGSPVDVQADTAYLGELDALTTRANAAREAWGYKVEAADRRMAADVARRGGQAQASAYRSGANATLIGGAANTALMLNQFGWGGGGRRAQPVQANPYDAGTLGANALPLPLGF